MALTRPRQNRIRSTASGTDYDDRLDLSLAETIVNEPIQADAQNVSGTLIMDMNFLRTTVRDIKGDSFDWFDPAVNTSGLITLSGAREEISVIQTFTGADADGDLTPDYFSTCFITQNKDLEFAIGQLDEALCIVTGTIDRQGWIYFTDLDGQGGGIVSDKIYQDPPGNTVIQSGTSDTLDITVDLRASYPLVDVGEVISGTIPVAIRKTLSRSGDSGHYSGTQDLTLSGTSPHEIRAQVVTPDNDDPFCGRGACDTTVIIFDGPPELLTFSFTGGYPGAQTELKAGDIFTVSGTTDKLANAIQISNFGAGTSQLLGFSLATSFEVTITIADRGTVTQALPARGAARNATGSFGSTRDTDELGGTTDAIDLVFLNNLFPSFIDNGTTFPPGQTAFKLVESGTQSTTVNDADTGTYTSPHGDFTISNPGIIETVKNITLTNPGDFNDSITNFRIVANRAANDATSTFNKVIEVADVAPALVVTQPQTRLRADDPAAQYLITATADQNIIAAPDIGIPVSGNFIGGGFVGGAKIFTRTIEILDGDATGIAAWILNAPIVNNALISGTSISGDENVGGFVTRTIIVDAWLVRESFIGHNVVDTSKLIVENTSKGGDGPNGGTIFTFQNSLLNGLDKYTITQPSGVLNNTGNIWFNADQPNAVSNTAGTAAIIIEETV